jgi:hypothetical protein
MAEKEDIVDQEVEQDTDVELEVVDDTPPEDIDPNTGKLREPMPKELVQELEQDELEDYSEKVKSRLKQMKKVWHDERREKEKALREHQAAVAMAQKALAENKALREKLSSGEKSYIDTAKSAAELELEMAKKSYKEAREMGDADRELEAQQKLTEANFKLQKIKDYRPSLQNKEVDVNIEQEQAQVPRPDQKTMAWQERNQWFGTDEEMTSLALGLHQKLHKQHGDSFIGTDEYWQTVDQTMKRRFPDYFGEDEEKTTDGGGKPVQRTETKPATVVAPASRSTSSKKIVLSKSEVALAKKFGLTPEQYAKEKQRLEAQNG